jgi:hypothetical protein
MFGSANQVRDSNPRDARRYEISAPVRYRSGDGAWLEGTTINIGRLGLLMRTRQAPPPESAVLEIRVALSGGSLGRAAYVVCSGHVVRTEPWLAPGDAEVEVALDEFHLRPARPETDTATFERSRPDAGGGERAHRP